MPILVQRTSRRRQWIGVALMAAFIAAGYWLSRTAPQELQSAGPAASDSRSFSDVLSAVAPGAAAEPASAAASAASVAAAPTPDGVPEGMTAQEWKDLQEALKDNPQRDIEIARVTEFMGYLARLERFRQLRADPAGAQAPDARELARGLLDQLPLRIGNGEVAGRDAVAIVEPLLETLFPDTAERDRQRAALRERMAQSTPEAPLLKAQSDRAARYASAEAAEIAQWNATPPERRDPHQLEAHLEALRREIFDEAPQGKPPAPSR